MHITKEQWLKIEATLSDAWGAVELKIDGYRVNLMTVKEKSLRYAVATYVNGIMAGNWMMAEAEADEAKRFFRKVSRYIFKPRERAALIKLAGGKRCPKAELARINRQCSFYSPTWTNVKAMRRHFEKNNHSLEVVHIGFQPC